MKTILLITALPALLGSNLPGPAKEAATSSFQAGVYGVCGCTQDATTTSTVALTISADGNFAYMDASGASHSEERNGRWHLEGRKLVLESVGTVPQVWTMDKDTPCLRTSSGLKSIRLCLLSECDRP